MKIVTLAFNRPDFIELQLNSLKKWVKDFEYIVYDNAADDSIKDECARLGIKCIPVKVFSEDPSWAVGISLDRMWEDLQHEKGELLYIDHDMFLINELPKFKCDMAFVPQKRADYTYPWTGLLYFNMDTLPNPGSLKWAVEYGLKDTDVGGRNHFYLEDNTPKTQEIEMWTLVDDNTYSFNGKDVTEGNATYAKMEFYAKDLGFPKPYSFDLFKLHAEDFFIFHYKSASNYPPFYTKYYNVKKTEALKKFLL